MKNKKLYFFAIIVTVLGTVIFTNVLLYAEERAGGSVTIVASVLPQRTIVVDKTLTIQKIYSNTSEEIRPSVFLDSMDGVEVPYSDAIRKQYEDLKTTVSFEQPGEVYGRDTRPIQSFIKKVVSLWAKWSEF